MAKNIKKISRDGALIRVPIIIIAVVLFYSENLSAQNENRPMSQEAIQAIKTFREQNNFRPLYHFFMRTGQSGAKQDGISQKENHKNVIEEIFNSRQLKDPVKRKSYIRTLLNALSLSGKHRLITQTVLKKLSQNERYHFRNLFYRAYSSQNDIAALSDIIARHIHDHSNNSAKSLKTEIDFLKSICQKNQHQQFFSHFTNVSGLSKEKHKTFSTPEILILKSTAAVFTENISELTNKLSEIEKLKIKTNQLPYTMPVLTELYQSQRPLFLNTLYRKGHYRLYITYKTKLYNEPFPLEVPEKNIYYAMFYTKDFRLSPKKNTPEIYASRYYLIRKDYKKLIQLSNAPPVELATAYLNLRQKIPDHLKKNTPSNEILYLEALYGSKNDLRVFLNQNPDIPKSGGSHLIRVKNYFYNPDATNSVKDFIDVEKAFYSLNPEMINDPLKYPEPLRTYAVITLAEIYRERGEYKNVIDNHHKYFAYINHKAAKEKMLYFYGKSLKTTADPRGNELLKKIQSGVPPSFFTPFIDRKAL